MGPSAGLNILPKKRWHVRTKDNIARVRRDEKRAADEEKRRLERVLLAEHETRLQKLKEKATERYGLRVFDQPGTSSEDLGIGGPEGETQKHVNLFSSLEEEERKNLASGNVEYQVEKKKEREEWESKMGIMKYLAEGSNEFMKTQSWYDKPPDRSIYEDAKSEKRPTIVKPFLQRILPQPKAEKKTKKEKKAKKEKRKKHKKRSRKSSSSSSSETESESEGEKERKHRKLEKLRAERLAREREEQRRAQQLLRPKTEVPETKPKKDPKSYNSQFFPELARQNLPKPEKRY